MGAWYVLRHKLMGENNETDHIAAQITKQRGQRPNVHLLDAAQDASTSKTVFKIQNVLLSEIVQAGIQIVSWRTSSDARRIFRKRDHSIFDESRVTFVVASLSRPSLAALSPSSVGWHHCYVTFIARFEFS